MNLEIQITGPQVIQLLTCSTLLSMKFQQLVKTKMLKNKNWSFCKHSDVVLNMLMNVKMPTYVGILTFISMIFHAKLSENENSLIVLGPGFIASILIFSSSSDHHHQKFNQDLQVIQDNYKFFFLYHKQIKLWVLGNN